MPGTDKELLIKVRADIDKAVKDLEKISGRIGEAGKQSARSQRDVRRLGRSFNYLRNAVAAYLSLRTVQQAVRLADAYNVLQTRIRTATKDTGDYTQVSTELFDITQQNGIALATTVSLFQNLARSAPELNATNAQMLTLTNTVQQLGVISGASNANLKAGLLQFSQAMSADIVRAEELNSLLENVPELANRIAKGLGLTTGELRNAVIEGEILSKDVFDSLLKQAPEIASEFEDIPLSVERAGTQLENSFSKFLGQLDEATGVTTSIADGLKSASEYLDDSNAQEFLNTLKDIAIVAGSLAAGRLIGPLIASIGASALLSARSIGNMNGQLAVMEVRSLVAATASRTLLRALSLLGGPAGIIIAAATALTFWSSSNDDATKSTESLWRETDVLLGKMEALRKLDLESAIDGHISAIDKLKSRIDFFNTASPRYGFKQGDIDKATAEIERHEAALVELRTKLETVGNAKEKDNKKTKELSKEEQDLAKKIEDTIKSLELQAATLGLTAREAALYKLKLQGANQAQLERANIALQAVETENEFQQALSDSAEEINKQNEEYHNWNQSLLDAAENVRQLIDPTRTYKLELEQLTVLYNAGKITAEEYAAAQDILKKQIDDTNKSLDETSKFAERAAENIQSALGDEINSLLEGNFKDIGNAFERMVNRMVAEALAADLAKRLLGDFGKDGQTSIGGLVGSFFNAIGFAGGGHVQGPGTGTSDSIPARLSDGEYVVKASAVSQYGVSFMDALNNRRFPSSTGIQRKHSPKVNFADGGLVTSGNNSNRPIVVNMNITTPNAESFKRSEGQLGLEAARKLNRAMRRNG